jgi:hypothetical protein
MLYLSMLLYCGLAKRGPGLWLVCAVHPLLEDELADFLLADLPE